MRKGKRIGICKEKRIWRMEEEVGEDREEEWEMVRGGGMGGCMGERGRGLGRGWG